MVNARRAGVEGLDLLDPAVDASNGKIFKNPTLYWLLGVVSIVAVASGVMIGKFAFPEVMQNSSMKVASGMVGTDLEFVNFVGEHGKQYQDVAEYEYRKSVWKANKDYVEKQNAKGLSYTLAMNKFGDMSLEEFKQKMLTYNANDRAKSALKAIEHTINPENVAAPISIDWRSTGCVTPIKDQEQCGSCWAFSASGAIESAVCIKTGTLYSLSEQQLMDCSSPPNYGCSGGWMEEAISFVAKFGGLCTEKVYPYKGVDGTCMTNCTQVAPIAGYAFVTKKNEEGLKEAVTFQGPISVAVAAGNNDFMFYESGVLDAPCEYQLDHGVLAVGYGTDKKSDKDYWIVKNSWGPKWGEDGYLRMSRAAKKNGAGECGIYLDMTYVVV